MTVCKMITPKTMAMLVFFLFMQTILSSPCNEINDISPCTCFSSGRRIQIDCSGSGLRSVPDNLPTRTSTLDFSNNLLQPDNVKSICEYNYLEKVSIAGNRLTRLKPRSLRKCDSVKRFDFSDNVFDSVTKYTLYGLEFTPVIYGLEARDFKEDTLADMFSLKELGIVTHQGSLPIHLFKDKKLKKLTIGLHGTTNISEMLFDPLASTLNELTLISSSIQRVPELLLSNFKALETCTLHVAELHNIPSTLFQNVALYNTLKNISLSGVKSLPRNQFWGLGGLRHLEIHGSEDVPSYLFQGLLGLQYLDLSSSSVSTIPSGWFVDLWSLETLILHDIGLTVTKKEDFHNLGSLERLDLSKNNLRKLHTELFHDISASVKFINISENILKMVPRNLFKEHAVLECLDISKNQIYSIESGAFYQLSELKRLYLQNNKLYDLESDTFIHNVNMAYLELSSNILIDLPGELFGSTHRLEVLNLSDNGISDLEKSIKFNIPTLREINLSFNPIECNCGTLSVKELLSKVSIIGDCEKPQPGIAIVDFVPDTNCILKSDTDLFGTKFTSSTVFLYPSESKNDVWESDTIINANDAVSKSVGDNKSSTVTVTTGNVLYTSSQLSDFWMNNFTISNYPSKETNDFTISKLNVSEFNGVAALDITHSTSYETTVSVINKSAGETVNISQVYSSDQSLDFSIHNLNTLKGDKTRSAGNEIVSKLKSYTTPTVGVYKTDETLILKTEQSGTFETGHHSSAFTRNEGTRYVTITPTSTLEPSFKTLYATSYTDSVVYVTRTVSESVQPTPVSRILPSDVSQTRGDLVLPSSVTVVTEQKDVNTMTDGLHYTLEITGTNQNVTALPPIFELGFANVTSEPEMAGKENSDYFYLSLGSILSVAILSLLILVFLYYKRRRGTLYEVQTRTDLDVFNLDHSFHEDGRVTPNTSLCQLKDVPSIQIESVDDDGNIRVEIYPTTKT